MDFTNVKKMFSLKSNDSLMNGTTAPQSESKKSQETYTQYGFRMAGISQGVLQAFTPNLQSVYLGLKKEQEDDENLQNELKLSLQNKKANLERDIDIETNKLEQNKSRLSSLEEDLQEKKRELAELKTTEYQRNRSAWITLIISSVILIPFTLYFFIFYSSVAYSAFFKQFSLDDIGEDGNFKLSEAIFDPQALSAAASEGATALLFILLMPIIFLAFGFVLNRWEREEGWLKCIKIPLIIVVAFIFDTLLSYEICEKIDNLYSQMSLAELPPYSLALASIDPRFWLIICLGFVAYLIWGFTFGYFFKSLDQLDLNKIHHDHLCNEMANIKDKIADAEKAQTENTTRIASLRAEIQIVENQLNGTVARYDINKIKLELNHFLGGWQQYMAAMGKSEDEKNTITEEFNRTIQTLITI